MCLSYMLELTKNDCSVIASFILILFIFVGIKLMKIDIKKDTYDNFSVNILTSLLIASSINSVFYILIVKNPSILLFLILPISIIIIIYLYRGGAVNTIKVIGQ